MECFIWESWHVPLENLIIIKRHILGKKIIYLKYVESNL